MLSLIHTSFQVYSHLRHLRLNEIHQCCHMWYLTLKHLDSVHHYFSPVRFCSGYVLKWWKATQNSFICRAAETESVKCGSCFGPTGRLNRWEPKPDVLMRETGGKKNVKGTGFLLSERYAHFKKHQLCFAFAALRPAALAQHTHTHADTHAPTYSPWCLCTAYGSHWFCCWLL